MATVKAIFSLMLILLVTSHYSNAQSCTSSLRSLNVCAPFVVPGSGVAPNADCCAVLHAMDHDCICNTLRIASRIPSQCNLPPLTCGNGGN